ncbi:hypothetical protein WJ969_26955 [Achromobacter xylosoxidans]
MRLGCAHGQRAHPTRPPAGLTPDAPLHLRIDLRRLILWISLLSIFLVLAAGLHASYLVQRDLLLHNALESNRVYAAAGGHHRIFPGRPAPAPGL